MLNAQEAPFKRGQRVRDKVSGRIFTIHLATACAVVDSGGQRYKTSDLTAIPPWETA